MGIVLLSADLFQPRQQSSLCPQQPFADIARNLRVAGNGTAVRNVAACVAPLEQRVQLVAVIGDQLFEFSLRAGCGAGLDDFGGREAGG